MEPLTVQAKKVGEKRGAWYNDWDAENAAKAGQIKIIPAEPQKEESPQEAQAVQEGSH